MQKLLASLNCRAFENLTNNPPRKLLLTYNKESTDGNKMSKDLHLKWIKLLRGMRESVSLKEETISYEQKQAKLCDNSRTLLEALYLDEDREASFTRFLQSQEFHTTLHEINRHANGNKNIKICEIGAGHGFLSLALAKAGFTNVCILEPNPNWVTGTGFTSKIADSLGVKIWNDLAQWYESEDLYDLVITKACVHHFNNVCKTAAEIRLKLRNNAKWMMFDEYFANSTRDLYTALINHAHIVKFGQYEWPYSSDLYVSLLDLAGFKLVEIIPNRFKNNHLTRNEISKIKFSGFITTLTNVLASLKFTAMAFKLEKFIDLLFGLDLKQRLFTLPQLMVFQPKSIGLPEIPQ